MAIFGLIVLALGAFTVFRSWRSKNIFFKVVGSAFGAFVGLVGLAALTPTSTETAPQTLSAAPAPKVAPAPNVGSLRVLVKPADARVTVQGTAAGQTYYKKVTGSNKFGNLSLGSYTVTVSKPGHQTIERTVEVSGNIQVSYSIKSNQQLALEARARQAEEARAAAAAERARLAQEPDPVAVEVVALNSSDNYGVEVYFVLTDSQKTEISVTGTARLRLTVKDYLNDSEDTVFDQTYSIAAGEFRIGTRGLGAFKRDSIFYTLGKIGTEKLSGETGNVYLDFTDSQGARVRAKDFISYP